MSSTGVPWRSAKLRAILACTLVLPLGVALLSPVLPVLRDAFGLTDAHTSLLFTSYFLPGVLLAPIIGLLADRVGRRAVLLPSLVCYGLLGSAIAFVDAFVVVLALRLLQGAAATGVFILTVTFITDVFDGVQRNAVLGINAAVLFLGAALYPFAGGFLAGYGWHVPFLTYLFALPVFGYVLTRLDEPPVVECRTGPGYVQGALRALPRIEAGALYGATFALEVLAFGAILTGLPFVLATEFGAPPVITGSVITSMMLVACAVSAKNGAIARRRSNHRLVAISFCCYAVGFFAAWIATSIPIVLGGAGAVGVGFGLALPSVDAAIGRLAPPEYRAGAVSLRTSVTFLGRTVGPIAFTGIAQVTGYQLLLLASAVVALGIGVPALLVTDGTPRVEEESAVH